MTVIVATMPSGFFFMPCHAWLYVWYPYLPISMIHSNQRMDITDWMQVDWVKLNWTTCTCNVNESQRKIKDIKTCSINLNTRSWGLFRPRKNITRHYFLIGWTTLYANAPKHPRRCHGVRYDPKTNVGVKKDPRTCLTWLFFGPVIRVKVTVTLW